MEVANRGRGQATRWGLSGRHGRPGAARVSCGVVSAHAELVLCPGAQTRHRVGEVVGMLWGRFSEQHLTEEVVRFFRLKDFSGEKQLLKSALWFDLPSPPQHLLHPCFLSPLLLGKFSRVGHILQWARWAGRAGPK